MDSGENTCMQSKQSSANNHDRYSKYAREGHALTRDHARTIRFHANNSVQIGVLLQREGDLFFLPVDPSSEIYQQTLYNSCNLRIIVKSSPPGGISQFEFPHKKFCLFFFVLASLLFTHSPPPYSLLWYESTVRSIVVENLRHSTKTSHLVNKSFYKKINPLKASPKRNLD